MSVWPDAASPRSLRSPDEGDLISVRVSTEPRRLEQLLDCLATLPFPINPRLVHGCPTIVEFPAYESQVTHIREVLPCSGFDWRSVHISPMLESIAAAE